MSLKFLFCHFNYNSWSLHLPAMKMLCPAQILNFTMKNVVTIYMDKASVFSQTRYLSCGVTLGMPLTCKIKQLHMDLRPKLSGWVQWQQAADSILAIRLWAIGGHDPFRNHFCSTINSKVLTMFWVVFLPRTQLNGIYIYRESIERERERETIYAYINGLYIYKTIYIWFSNHNLC